MVQDFSVEVDTINVIDLLKINNLKIPEYQRPYKWSIKNVNQLIDDIIFQHQANVSEYRIGTVVIHKDENGNKNIVDGQQRSLTLTLIAYSIIKNHSLDKFDDKLKFNENDLDLLNQEFGISFANDVTQANLITNFEVIDSRVHDDFDEEIINFFLQKCSFVLVILNDISEAFQFFDSQNARGKDLEPHDLLKAFHLREMENVPEEIKKEVVLNWEKIETNKLSELFSLYLYRIRNWSKGFNAIKFTKNEVDGFKGISLDKKNNFPFTKIYTTVHFYTDYYNNHFNRNIDKHDLNYPFQLDQVIINGKRFFEMVQYYNNMMNEYETKMEQYKKSYEAHQLLDKYTNDDFENEIVKHLNLDDKRIAKKISTLLTYSGKERTGDRYVRILFDCAVLYYIDKFGFEEESYFSKIVEKFFYWAYELRVTYYLVKLASVDNHAIGENDNDFIKNSIPIFKEIREAMHPSDILNLDINNKVKRKTKVSEEIDEFFDDVIE